MIATREFKLTDEEARFAASRAAWRKALGAGGLIPHAAPLTAFALALSFAAVLGLTGLVSRRFAEIAILLAAAAFMAQRLLSRRRFYRARREANAWAKALQAAGPMKVARDEEGFWLETAHARRAWRFCDGVVIEQSSGLAFVWPPRGDPLVWPSRAQDEDLLATAAPRRFAAAADDDDD